jgi:hypothetical protein
MKLWMKMAFWGLIVIIIFAACASDKEGPKDPASATATTNASGRATLNIGSFTVNATVVNESQAGLAGIELTGHLSHENVIIIAVDPSGTNYPSITGVAVSSGKKAGPSRIQSPDEIANAALAATITMYPVQVSSYNFTSDPFGFSDFIEDDWTTETGNDGLLSDMYNVIVDSTISTYDDCVFLHLSAGVETEMSSPVRTAVFVPSRIADFATFSTLVNYAFNIFEGDSVHYCQVTYNNAMLPVLYIDNVVVTERNFWAQFMLTWDENPRDLDSHLWTPKYGPDSTRYHTYYSRKGHQFAAPFDSLDIDDLTSFGPEHVTIYEPYPGVYTYAVYHFSGSGTLATSGASVVLWKQNGSSQTFNVPTDTTGVGDNWWWWVCTVNGTTGEVITINTLHEEPPYGNYIIQKSDKQLIANEK